MYKTCLQKQEEVKKTFSSCQTLDAVYDKIIELGKGQKNLTEAQQEQAVSVTGCQSKMLLFASYSGGIVTFQTESDALISAGLGVLMSNVYSGETPEAILKCPPDFLEDLGITKALSPNRANGLASLHLTMKQAALKFLVGKS